MRWFRASSQRPRWRSSAIKRRRPDLATYYPYRYRCSSGLYTSNPARDGDSGSSGGAVYRRPIDSNGPLEPLGGGMPKWTRGSPDTNCIATRDSIVAMIDRSGRLYVSHDDGASWSSPLDLVDSQTIPSGLCIC